MKILVLIKKQRNLLKNKSKKKKIKIVLSLQAQQVVKVFMLKKKNKRCLQKELKINHRWNNNNNHWKENNPLENKKFNKNNNSLIIWKQKKQQLQRKKSKRTNQKRKIRSRWNQIIIKGKQMKVETMKMIHKKIRRKKKHSMISLPKFKKNKETMIVMK